MKWTSDIVLTEPKLKAVLTEHIMANPEKFGVDTKTDKVKEIRLTTKSDPSNDGYGYSRDVFDRATIIIERTVGED